ncbi:regulator of G-protein signaling 5-like isoform X1 [Hypomesus transpacificus]|uniref:regulator of G-protein signaling 5-like isoform X1 n=1 Tax=Hypomesus transpacificus TaxID=137520 RepID=UPI001F071574|nr:regulator of G-protein signaling 5-like isoform X1 [Hypomesus transpacificus]
MCRGLATLPATCLKSARDIKHKIGFLLQKPDLLPDSKNVKDRSIQADRVPDGPSKVQKWKESFNNVMNSEGPPECQSAGTKESEQWPLENLQSLDLLIPQLPPRPPGSDGRTVFADFLKSEFSQENMEFWNACEDYKKTPLNKMVAKAKQIYEEFVEADSPNEVNLDSATREETKQNLQSAGPSCFHEAQMKIFTLMEKDSYRRFLCSKRIQDLSASAGPPAPQEASRGVGCVPGSRKALMSGA